MVIPTGARIAAAVKLKYARVKRERRISALLLNLRLHSSSDALCGEKGSIRVAEWRDSSLKSLSAANCKMRENGKIHKMSVSIRGIGEL